MKGFSFSKLTELQVQGARDRSNRQIERSQLAGRLDSVEREWKSWFVPGSSNDKMDGELFCQAIKEVFHDRDMSPFMVARLSELCRREFLAGQAEKGLQQLHNDQRAGINWMYQEIERLGEADPQIAAELETRISELKTELNDVREAGIENLRKSLEWKKSELIRLRKQKLEELERMEKQEHFKPKQQEAVLVEKWTERSESWEDVDDDYFQPNNGGSEWVLCS